MSSEAERPILFSAPMVRALLSGAKTQTRRVMKPQPSFYDPSEGFPIGNERRTSVEWKGQHCAPETLGLMAPHGNVGDGLWVKETFKPHSTFAHLKPSEIPDSKIFYRADNSYAPSNTKWWPSLFMQRRFSRILLDIVDVRVQRLHDITEADAEAEGVYEPSLGDLDVVSPNFIGKLARSAAPPLVLWEMLWKRINGDASWNANPWVWAYTFKRVQP